MKKGTIMNRTRKILLIVVVAIVAAGLLWGAASLVVTQLVLPALADIASDDPGMVGQVGRSIAFYDLPPGFGQGYAVTQADYQLVTYLGPDGRTHITLFQMPGAEPDELEQRLHDIGARAGMQTAVNERHTMQIGSQQGSLLIGEGTNGEGIPIRSVTLLFNGRGGPALVNIAGPVATWDKPAVDKFLASLR